MGSRARGRHPFRHAWDRDPARWRARVLAARAIECRSTDREVRLRTGTGVLLVLLFQDGGIVSSRRRSSAPDPPGTVHRVGLPPGWRPERVRQIEPGGIAVVR